MELYITEKMNDRLFMNSSKWLETAWLCAIYLVLRMVDVWFLDPPPPPLPPK